MSETFPTRLTGMCTDCGAVTIIQHPDGIGGEGTAWPCPVCGNPMAMDGAAYVESEAKSW